MSLLGDTFFKGIAGDWGYAGQYGGRKMLARGC